ncbi:flagellar biosynthesis protein FlhA [Notoacmeibacter sp. MSK16QG-6]|uniref:flagellar biosynthesis protein FlhA n=1 Tax=Notoacmeibacter sp. MSK16QG-6 TaxID=2957982 RepID=UPI003530E4F4
MSLVSSSPANNVAAKRSDIGLAVGVAMILVILFLPIPSFLIDMGLALSLSLSILILLVALWIDRPLDFSAFPTVLLIATMLRLSLNIATTRVILSEGHEGENAAGHVIGGFAKFVMGGDFLIGVVVFLILVVVNFIVITKGATRIAEVGARFTLDAIPGKQMSIDADLGAGIITEKEAQIRRRELEEESSFFGSMDGASKFVRGDAVAGLIITAVNVFGGIAIGYSRHDMNFGEAADVFVKLSVGDGLISQIPALITSLAAGLLVSKGGTRGSADVILFKQLGAYPRALYVGAGLLSVLAFMPGLPFLPFIILAGVFAGTAIRIQRIARDKEALAKTERDAEIAEQQQADDRSLKHSLTVSEIEVVMGKQVSVALLPQNEELTFRMSRIRKKFASEYGFVIPEVAIKDDLTIPPGHYQIRVFGTVLASYELRLGEVLALCPEEAVADLPSVKVKEPAFGMDAMSLPGHLVDELKRRRISTADNVSVLLTHLSEVVRNNLPQLLSYKAVRHLIDRLEPEYRKLADDICTNHLSYPGLQAILKMLLADRVSIRNLNLILEAVAEVAPHMRRTEKLVEHVRMRISQQICGDLSKNGVLNVLRLGTQWDILFQESLRRDNNGEVRDFDMNPAALEKFADDAGAVITGHAKSGVPFTLLTSAETRPYVRMILERLHPSLPVIAHSELARGMQVKLLGSIG